MRVVLHCPHSDSLSTLFVVGGGDSLLHDFRFNEDNEEEQVPPPHPFLNDGFTRPPILLQVIVGDEPRVEK